MISQEKIFFMGFFAFYYFYGVFVILFIFMGFL